MVHESILSPLPSAAALDSVCRTPERQAARLHPGVQALLQRPLAETDCPRRENYEQ